MNPYLVSLVALVPFLINDVIANETKATILSEWHLHHHPSSMSLTSYLDKKDYRFESEDKQTCIWIQIVESRRQTLCQHEDVILNCPVTCGYYCEEDTNYEFEEKYESGGIRSL